MALVQDVAALVDALHPERRVAVAVDGPDAAGKSTFARALVQLLARPVLLVALDDWHHPRAVRTQRGPDSPEGCYHDTTDRGALETALLEPFRAGARTVQTAAFDHARDVPAPLLQEVPGPGAALVVEGVFVLRPELRRWWDLAVHLHVPEPVTLERARLRDGHLYATQDELVARYRRRYLPAQELYRQDAGPLEHADVVVDSSDPAAPVVLAWPSTGARVAP